MSFSFYMLGPFELRKGGSVITLPKSKKARAVLAYVALAKRPTPRERLVELFFADTRDPKGGLRWVISRLRAAADKDLIATDSATIALGSDSHSVDVGQLEQPIRAETPVEGLDHIVRLVRGEFLADLSIARCSAYEAWRLARQVAINNQHAALLAELIRKTMGSTEATQYARRLLALDDSREASWACLVETLLASNQLPDARQIQHLAIQQLERDGVSLGGQLEQVWSKYGAGNGGKIATPVAGGTNALGLKPRVGVLQCRIAGADTTIKPRSFAEAVFRACNVNKSVTVLAPSLSATLNSAPGASTNAAQEMGIDLLLEPSVSMREGGYQVQVELTDVKSGVCLFVWRLQSDAASEDAAADRLEAYLSARMEIDLPLILIGRIHEKSQSELTARDRYLLALPCIFSADGFDPVSAYELLETALSQQPHFGQASCVLSFIRMFMPQYNDNDEQIAVTVSLARRAVEICQDDAFVLGIAAVNIAQIERDTDTGLDLTRRALGINPHSVMARLSAAMISHYGGDDDACLRHVDAVEANSETDPVTFECHTCRAMAHYQKREYDEALRWSRKAVGHNPKHVIALRYLVASLAMSGELDEAKKLVREIVAVDPSENVGFFERRSGYCSESRLQHLCEGLRLAGMPETA